jgi:hypothetical protein
MHFKESQFIAKRPIDFIVEFRTSKNPKNFLKKYNIIVNNDGSIYDLDLKKGFECMYNWANTIGKINE